MEDRIMISNTPELNNWKSIGDKLNSGNPATIQAATGQALQNLVLGIVNTQHTISSIKSPLVKLADGIEKLNENIEKASDSADNLAKKANKLVLYYTILTGVLALAAIVGIIY